MSVDPWGNGSAAAAAAAADNGRGIAVSILLHSGDIYCEIQSVFSSQVQILQKQSYNRMLDEEKGLARDTLMVCLSRNVSFIRTTFSAFLRHRKICKLARLLF